MAGPGFIPDSQLVFSADLAATLGLEEAVLVQQLKGLYQHLPATETDGLNWLHVSRGYLCQLLPFWSAADLDRICVSLEAQGLLHLNRQSARSDTLLFALAGSSAGTLRHESAEPSRAPAPASPRPSSRPVRGEGEPLPRDFTPSEDMLELLERFHQVPRAFSLQQVEDFMLYWRERGSAGHAWQNKFKQHVLFHWARHQQGRGVDGEHKGQQGIGGSSRTRDRSLEQDLTDTSWAD